MLLQVSVSIAKTEEMISKYLATVNKVLEGKRLEGLTSPLLLGRL